MQISRFNVLAEREWESKILLFNTYTDSQIVCDDKTAIHHLFDKITSHEILTDEEEETALSLYDLGFLIDDFVDEQKEFLNWFDAKIRNNHERISTLVVTSRTCNLRCPYCFERDVLDAGLNMKQETAERLVTWLSARIEKHRPKIVDITFFGGEPLMNVPVLRTIAREIHSFCAVRGVAFEFGMITNGVLLTPALVEELKPLGMVWVKITLDGDKTEHDKLRITKSGKGTFDRIWKNLEEIKGMIPVYIGGNFDPSNQESLPRLVDKLAEAPFKENLFAVQFKPIQATRTKEDTSTKLPLPRLSAEAQRAEEEGERGGERVGNYSEIRTDCAEPAFSPEQIGVMMEAREYIRGKRLPTSNQIGIGPCELHRKSYFGVDMDGDLYKCSAMVGRKEFASGSIWKGEDLEKVDERMGTGIRPWKDCGPCPFIPVCAGGCKAAGYDRYGDFTVGSCDKLYFKAMVGEMFERNLRETAAYEDGLQFDKVEVKKTGLPARVGPAPREAPGHHDEGTGSFAV